MQKKQNKKAAPHTSAPSSSLSSRKTPLDANGHLDFSITKKVIHHEDYEALVKTRGYRNRTAGARAASSVERKVAEPSPKARSRATAYAHRLPVATRTSRRSPYVVRLPDEWEQEAAKEIARAPGRAFQKTAVPVPLRSSASTAREMERLRREAAGMRQRASRVTINLLGRVSAASPSARKRKRSSVARSALHRSVLSLAGGAARGVVRWLFEFVLSIPLGFLLGAAVLLSLVEVGNRGAIRVARLLGAGVSWAIQHAFFAIIAAVRAVLVIPIKILAIAVAGVYRAVSEGGTFALLFARAAYETARNYVSVFFRPPKNFYRKLAALMFVAVLVMLPVKFLETVPEQIGILRGSVLGATREGYANIASLDIVSARTSFNEARASLSSLNAGMRALVEVLPAGQDGLHAIGAGVALAAAGQYLAEAVADAGDSSPIVLLERMRSSLAASLPHLQSAQTHLALISPESVPPEYREKFTAATEALPRGSAAIQDGIGLLGALSELLGSSGSKRYAVLFQNNNELRPAGGFIGSLAFVDVAGGQVTNIDVPGGGAYDFQGYLSEHVKAPKPLSLINSRWELQDANWYPDWPRSARKVVWFLEHAGFSTVDGVIAVQATTLEKLLALTGPVEAAEYEVTLTSENVLDHIQREVELAYDKEENKPKAYIGELLPLVLQKLLASGNDDLLAILALVRSEITEKNILFYFSDEATNRLFAQRGWQPSIVSGSADYLSVVHANIGGGKTDGVISESWDQEITVDGAGNVFAELTVIRQHNGDPGNPFTGANNVDYVRVYAPEGSELVSFEGAKPPDGSLFERPQPYYQDDAELAAIEGKVIIDEASGTRITNEFGKTVFGNWLQVSPGNVAVANVKYQLPFRIKPYDVLNPNARNGYALIIQKQPGARPIPYSVSLRYPTEWSVSWSKAAGDGKVDVLGPGLTVFEGQLASDTGFAVSFEK